MSREEAALYVATRLYNFLVDLMRAEKMEEVTLSDAKKLVDILLAAVKLPKTERSNAEGM